MSVIEGISRITKSGYDDDVLMDYIQKNLDTLECELNGDEHKEPEKCDRNFYMGCKLRKIVDYERSILTCTIGVVYVSTIQCMLHHTIIRCNHWEENVYTEDPTISK